MKERGVLLNREKLRHMNGAVATDSTQVVSQEVYDHDVLRAILFACGQLLAQTRVLFHIRTARPCSLNGPRLDRALFVLKLHAQESFGRSADDNVIASAYEGGEGSGMRA